MTMKRLCAPRQPRRPTYKQLNVKKSFAYRKALAELRDGEINPLPEIKCEAAVISDWTIDSHGCLTRTIGE